MAAKYLKIDQLELDVLNPRINAADNQHEAMQRIIDDQDGNSVIWPKVSLKTA